MRNTLVLLYSFIRDKGLPMPVNGQDTEYPPMGWALPAPTQDQVAILVNAGVVPRQIVIVQS
jgi:hypothetical protein